jgi:hypothetical protein
LETSGDVVEEQLPSLPGYGMVAATRGTFISAMYGPLRRFMHKVAPPDTNSISYFVKR